MLRKWRGNTDPPHLDHMEEKRKGGHTFCLGLIDSIDLGQPTIVSDLNVGGHHNIDTKFHRIDIPYPIPRTNRVSIVSGRIIIVLEAAGTRQNLPGRAIRFKNIIASSVIIILNTPSSMERDPT